MAPPIHILHGGDLYEIRYEGTLLTSIRKWYSGGQRVTDTSFHSLPEEVKKQLILKIKNGQKTKAKSKGTAN
jgi:hypothetical protein